MCANVQGVLFQLSACILSFVSVAECFCICVNMWLLFYIYLYAQRHRLSLIVYAKRFSSLSLCVCISVCVCVFIIAKSPSSMMGSKWPTVVHSKQQRLAALEDRVLSEHRKTFLSLLMYL